jgi:hypothetical protein
MIPAAWWRRNAGQVVPYGAGPDQGRDAGVSR